MANININITDTGDKDKAEAMAAALDSFKTSYPDARIRVNISEPLD